MTRRLALRFWSLMSHILGRPILASFIVGTAILSLNAVSLWYYEGMGYLEFLKHCYRLSFMLSLSKVGPPYLIPFLVTTAGQVLQRKRSEMDFMEDAIPAMFIITLPKNELARVEETPPEKVNPAYVELFGIGEVPIKPGALLPERCWVEPHQRGKYFAQLLETREVAGFKAKFIDRDGTIWSGSIFSRCKEERKELKIQGIVVPD